MVLYIIFSTKSGSFNCFIQSSPSAFEILSEKIHNGVLKIHGSMKKMIEYLLSRSIAPSCYSRCSFLPVILVFLFIHIGFLFLPVIVGFWTPRPKAEESCKFTFVRPPAR